MVINLDNAKYGLVKGIRLKGNTLAQGAKVFLPWLSGVLAFYAFQKVLLLFEPCRE